MSHAIGPRFRWLTVSAIASAIALAACGSAALRPDGGDDAGGSGGSGSGGKGGASSKGGTGGAAGTGTGGVAGSATGSAGTGGNAGGTGGGGAAGAGGGSAGGGGTAGSGGAAGRGGTTGTGGGAGTGGATAGTGGGSAGRGGSAGGAAGTGGSGGTPDTTRPQILDAAPFNGQTGVASNAKVVITFSEAMNQTSVKNAYSSTSLLPAQVTFSWNAAGTILTITPNNPLAYASGTSLTTPATSYAYSIGTGAADLAGNTLAAAFTSTFTTLRRITATTPGTNVFGLLDSTPQGPSQVRPIVCDQAANQGNNVGRAVSLAFTSVRKLYIELDIPAAPAGVTTVETATFRGMQTSADGNPYAMAPMTADQIPFQANPDATSNTVTPVRSLGTFANSTSTAMPEISVTAMLQQAFTSTAAQLMLRLQIDTLPSVQSLAYFSCSGFLATWTYLVP